MNLKLNKVLPILLILALAQFACSFSLPNLPATSQPSSSSTSQGGQLLVAQPTPALGSQQTQPSASQPTQPPVSKTTSTHGTPEQAMTMLQKAVAHYNSVGRTQALSDFTKRVAPFFYLDLYVACIDSNLRQSANGGYPNLVGSAIEPISRAAWDAATTTKIDSVNYAYLDPATGTTEPKTLYFEKVGSDVCGVGAYHPY
ncbi:MAG TPA: hypothetical protein VKF38_13695 [Anaerolineaceae bacterium]|nr:hypothetical protein [Anaerolineaceae bacterium]